MRVAVLKFKSPTTLHRVNNAKKYCRCDADII